MIKLYCGCNVINKQIYKHTRISPINTHVKRLGFSLDAWMCWVWPEKTSQPREAKRACRGLGAALSVDRRTKSGWQRGIVRGVGGAGPGHRGWGALLYKIQLDSLSLSDGKPGNLPRQYQTLTEEPWTVKVAAARSWWWETRNVAKRRCYTSSLRTATQR